MYKGDVVIIVWLISLPPDQYQYKYVLYNKFEYSLNVHQCIALVIIHFLTQWTKVAYQVFVYLKAFNTYLFKVTV